MRPWMPRWDRIRLGRGRTASGAAAMIVCFSTAPFHRSIPKLATNIAYDVVTSHARHLSKYDVLVVRGGGAGLRAAMVLLRAGRAVMVVDACAPRNAPAAAMHGFLSRDGMPRHRI